MRRRQLLKSIVIGTAGIASSGCVGATKERLYSQADGDIDYDDTFAKKEWGYVRHDWDPPTGTDRPVVYTHDGYMGASFAANGPTHYIRMPDDTLIATSVGVYSAIPSPDLGDEYVHVQSSVRATACSAGDASDFGEVYDKRSHGLDGHEIIEWLAARPWSLDRIGLFGLSYSGMTSIRVASTQPPSLACVSANVIMGDLLRGRTFPGGVDNLAFDNWLNNLPTLWWDEESQDIIPEQEDPFCRQHRANRDPQTIIDQHPTWYRKRTENDGYRRINFIEMAKQIEVPTYISVGWQDGQVGQRGGPAVYNALDPDPIHPGDFPGRRPPSPELRESPKLLRATNGVHGTAWRALGRDRDGRRWFDYWLRGENTGIMQEAPVRLDFGMDTKDSHGTMSLDGFPASNTDWTRYYIGGNHELTTERPTTAGKETYTSSSPDYWYIDDLTDKTLLSYWSAPFEKPRVIAGPITATLYLQSSAENTEMYVSLADVEPGDEAVTYLQRGMLRASHRELNEAKTLRNEAGEIIRPYHTMVDPTPIISGERYRYDIEVFPLGHIVYPGHRLLVNIHAPPQEEGPDPARYWEYDPLDSGSENILSYGGDTPSSVLLPMLEWGSKRGNRTSPLPPEPACGEPDGYTCMEATLPQ
ncbi:X-Pro dipeptidyl-peptidase (S15 family) [Halalkalicoccus paucihalophilus]|uniref:X-Pro dipeptidyl-peptidase (S15 family) n=2 Tax=Halalkalicoccus paucihalophilus TaxID=1008153 RepID=A0A151A9T7_9EURY|nr:CocE/NonD family hydrolase [Halalkalicoccus paucihalophilus]KYH24373.1 X-Pro dipeptidyl-peptidase (S15 family) [Halalkalicoccus paucihalophilus]